MESVPKLTPISYFSSVELCVYPPTTAKNVEFFSGFPLEYETESNKKKAFDVVDRQGKCYGRGITSETLAKRNFGLTWEVEM